MNKTVFCSGTWTSYRMKLLYSSWELTTKTM